MFEEIRDPKERVRAVCRYGCTVEVDPAIPVRRYFRSGMEIIRMANVYYDEKNYESAYILYSKFITLFVEKLPKHPDYKSAPTADKSNNKNKLKTIFPRAEQVKKILTTIYTTEEEKRREQEKRLAAEQRALEEKKRKEEEEKRRLQEERKKHLSEQKWQEEEERLRREEEEEYRRLQDEEIRKQQEMAAAAAAAAAATASPGDAASTPTAPPPDYSSVYSPDGTINSAVAAPTAPPEVNRNLKPAAPPHGILVNSTNKPPEVNRATKPVDHFTSTGGHSSNPFGLRDCYVPTELMVKFLNLAQRNTTNNIETCGILCGKLAQDAFRITHLIIPKQRGTPDSCDTENEEELFDVQDKYDLITLGWIHTHPSQTAFLSSVDLHTHCSYQLMLPEAIAIVCSPKFNETGFFQLTPDYGLNFISSCREAGFHPHPKEPPLFDTCPHAKLDNAQSIAVVDLRR